MFICELGHLPIGVLYVSKCELNKILHNPMEKTAQVGWHTYCSKHLLTYERNLCGNVKTTLSAFPLHGDHMRNLNSPALGAQLRQVELVIEIVALLLEVVDLGPHDAPSAVLVG